MTKTRVHFQVDENDCVMEEVFVYERVPDECMFDHYYYAKVLSRGSSASAKRNGRKFKKENREQVKLMEDLHSQCEWYFMGRHACLNINFFYAWSASHARGLERHVSRKHIFRAERCRAMAAVLGKQQTMREAIQARDCGNKLAATAFREIEEALRRCSI
jgi:hypothetical protein